MHRTSLIAAASFASAVVMTSGTAVAAPATENLSRRAYDSTPELISTTWRIDGATAGPLGGFLDLTVTARDDALPTSPGDCEAVDATAVLTVSPGEVLTVSTPRGEVCAHPFGGTLSLNAWFRDRHLTYTGTEHSRVKVVGDGLLSASQPGFGSQASFNATVRW